jgi:hypothetical protein
MPSHLETRWGQGRNDQFVERPAGQHLPDRPQRVRVAKLAVGLGGQLAKLAQQLTQPVLGQGGRLLVACRAVRAGGHGDQRQRHAGASALLR